MVIALITTSLVGLVSVVLGIINMTGNISSVHEYHRKRVSEENKKPFGKLVGLGTVLIGVSVIVFGAFMFAFEKTELWSLLIIGNAALFVGMVAGLVISFYAMKKYNGGIF